MRILGNNLSNKKTLLISLTSIYGIGLSTSYKILKELGIPISVKITDLSENNISCLRELLEKNSFKFEGDLKRKIKLNIKHLIDIHSYRGRRHLKGLPVRGQRTRTNSRTSRLKSLFVTRKEY